MKEIDRLIIKAKQKCGVDQLTAGFISRPKTDPDKWLARGDIWNGVPKGGVTSESCLCDSIVAAEAFIAELGRKYPSNKDVVIFVDDLEE